MCTKRIVTGIIVALTCLGALAQEALVERYAGHELTGVRHSEQRFTLPIDTLSTDSLVEVRMLEVRSYVDTIRTVEQREKMDTLAADSSCRRGHYVEIHGGVGLGNVGYGFLQKNLSHPTATGYEKAGISGLVQLQYAYFFVPYVGFGVGAWLANYTSHGYLQGDFAYANQWDSDTYTDPVTGVQKPSEQYTHHATIKRWHERQTIHTMGVPLSLQFQAWGKQNKAGFFSALGVAPVYTAMTQYRVLEGEIEHWGDYGSRGAIHNAHEFKSISYESTHGALSLRKFSATAFLDLGLLVRMSAHTDLLLGVYGQYTFLNMLDDKSSPRGELGWKSADFPNVDVPEYKGILASTCINDKSGGSQLMPWQLGVKIGVHWHSIAKPRTVSVMYSDTLLQTVVRNDSVWTTRVDTLQRQIPRATEHIQREIDKLNRIYFAFDSYELTPEAMRSLDDIAEHIKLIPNKILLGGHASKEGTRAHNARLAKNRALVVKYYFVDQGVPATQMVVRDYGSEVKNAINLSEDLSLDRRVEIIVMDE